MPAEARSGRLTLGSQSIGVGYPVELEAWFAGRTSDAGSAEAVVSIEVAGDGLFRAPTEAGEQTVAAGDALAMFWERASFHLVDPMADTLALHASAVAREGTLLLIAGKSGSGKTRMALWYRQRGYELLTDEITCLGGDEKIEVTGTLNRPVFVKGMTDVTPLLGPGEAPEQVASKYGTVVNLPVTAAGPVETTIAIFPSFRSGASLSIRALSRGEIALRLLGNCLNVRNLSRGGLAPASALAGKMRGVAVEFGSSAQLEGLDTLARLGGKLTDEEFAACCAGLNAAAMAGVTAPQTTARVVPPRTEERFPRRLTVGMATYDDYDGTYFTIQAMRIASPQLRDEIEFVIVDNNPGGRCSEALEKFSRDIGACRYIPSTERNGTAVRDLVFAEASSPVVLCVDCHVLIERGGIEALLKFFDDHPQSRDLVQGPMIYDGLSTLSTHWDHAWRAGMLGTWGTDERGLSPDGEPFEIPLQGLGVFACRREAWPGFNPMFRGFGGEEGYIHEKIRQRGGRTLCLPALRWVHRFARPFGIPYINRWEDRVRNYYIGMTELGLDTAPMQAHFIEFLGEDYAGRIFAEIRREFGDGTQQPAIAVAV